MSDEKNTNKRIKFSEEDIGTSVEKLEVTVSHILFAKNDFYIFACKEGMSVKGKSAREITVGMHLQVSGIVGTYGRTFQISATEILLSDDKTSQEAVIASFLKENFDKLGDKRAMLIAKEYKHDCLEEFIKRPRTVSDKIAGLSEARALKISSEIQENQLYYETILKLRLFGLTDNVAKAAYKEFGVVSYEQISVNPYLLIRLDNVGFETCEELARGLNLNRYDINRVSGAVTYVLNELHFSTGGTYFLPETIRNDVKKLIDKKNEEFFALPADNINFDVVFEQACDLLTKINVIVVYRFNEGKCAGCGLNDENARISLKQIFLAEVSVKKEIESFLNAGKAGFDEEEAVRIINRLSEAANFTPDERQIQALRMCMTEPLSIVTGGPGTGKTTITGILSQHFKNENIRCVFCAPTGRAAKRLSEAVGVKAYTIHRLLEVRGETEGNETVFGRNSDNPIDARVIVVDEASMVDIFLFKALLYAVGPGSSLIIIGDPNQLPSVGPGNLLNDLLSCNSIPRVELSYVFRTENESSIASNSYRILQGKDLVSNEDDFILYEEADDEAVIKRISELYKQYGSSDADVSELAILTPSKQNLCGTEELNYRLQEISIDKSSEAVKCGSGALLYDKDKVMQVHNDYSIEYLDYESNEMMTGVYNGEIGQIKNVNTLEKSAKIVFDDGKNVFYEKKALENVDLAYAMTVHKAQGCEFDTVIICLGKFSSKLLSRRLFYTAVTRGKKRVIIVATPGRVSKMLKATDGMKRLSSLPDFLSILDSRHMPASDYIQVKLNGNDNEVLS